MSDAVIVTENLTKRFGSRWGRESKVAVQGVNLQVTGAQVYGFLGVNGAGKSTTIRMILDLMHPSQGRALVYGKDPRRQPDVLRRVGSLVEGATFYPYLSGWDNLRVIGNSQAQFNQQRATELVERVGLDKAIKVKVRAYSTGMKQRLGIAAALLQDPDLIILDEPTSGMDPAGIREMRRFIRDLAHEQGKTVFLTSHLLSEVQQTCDRLAIINAGQIIQEGALTDLLSQQSLYELDVSDVERTRNALQERWSVIPTENDGLLHINAPRADIPHIIKRLVEQGIDIYSMAPYRQSLEDYFLELVGLEEGKLS
ncbi:MAG: ABC transporter ATP-binding protein [Anaerolineales bacterium]|nr:ABC transporter ATP-binding protein [Anaerolineales bacterium]